MDDASLLEQEERKLGRVSVIIPVYNVQDYLEECLESVLHQTYSDLEILCINDCSTDQSLAILKQYAQKDSRVKIWENEENRGQAYARNLGLINAVGEFVLFVDADDCICPDLLEKCLEVSRDSDMVCFDYKQVTDGETDVKQDRYQMKDGLYDGGNFWAEAVCKESIIIAPWSKLYRRDFLTDHRVTFYNGIIYEDILFSFQCYVKARKVYSLNQKLYTYRVREQSTMRTGITEKSIGSYIICICELMKWYMKEDFDRKTSEAIEEYIRKVSREYISAYRRWSQRDCKPKFLEDKPEYLKVYRTFSDLCIKSGKIQDISRRQLEEIQQYQYIILYGAGDIARSTVEILDYYDIPLYGIAVTSKKGNRKSIWGNSVRELGEYYDIREQCLVIIGTTPKYYHEISGQLREQGFTHLMGIADR